MGGVGSQDEDGQYLKYIDSPCLDEIIVNIEGGNPGQMDKAQEFGASQYG